MHKTQREQIRKVVSKQVYFRSDHIYIYIYKGPVVYTYDITTYMGRHPQVLWSIQCSPHQAEVWSSCLKQQFDSLVSHPLYSMHSGISGWSTKSQTYTNKLTSYLYIYIHHCAFCWTKFFLLSSLQTISEYVKKADKMGRWVGGWNQK